MDESLLTVTMTVTEIEDALRGVPGVEWVSSQHIGEQWYFNICVAKTALGWDALLLLREVSEVPGVAGPPMVGVQPKPDTRRDASGSPPPLGSFLVFFVVEEPLALQSVRDVIAE